MRKNLVPLNGEWKLVWLGNRQVKDEKIEITTYSELNHHKMESIQATVPGNFELDLLKNKIIPDPFYGTNVTEMTRFEYVHMWYGREFDYYEDLSDAYLIFEGIDTVAEIFLNGVLVGKTDNMFISHKVPAGSLKSGKNDLVVHILPATIAARSLPSAPGDFTLRYNFAGLRVRKAMHMYGWDIMPRIVSGGLWRDVYLIRGKKDFIEDAYLYVTKIRGEGAISSVAFYYRVKLSEDEISRYSIQIDGNCGSSSFHQQSSLWFSSQSIRFDIPDSRLWWIKGRGAQNLYLVTVRLLLDGKEIDAKIFRFGIRTVELVRTSVTDSAGSGDFHIKLNGERVFIKGTNWVPADAFHSRDKERIPKILELVKDIGCNTIRCWGGNVYEDHEFFDFCDENGIIVWQDFDLSCSIYPQDDEFCRMIASEVRSVVSKLRQHPSLCIWSGDNECDVAYAGDWSGLHRDPNQNTLTRKVIPDILKMEDPARPYLPSSPFIDSAAFDKGLKYLTEDHLWGPRDYYKSSFYKNSLAHFASEMGYHGCNAPKSVERFISPENRWPAENCEWMVHCAPPESKDGPYSYRRKLMFKQVKELFGKVPDDLERFALASQISQAEAFKFFIELFRCMKWRRTGIIWWNLMDGWPQFSDAVVDYYFNKKLAYHYIRRSQQPFCLMFGEPENWRIRLCASNDTKDCVDFNYKITDITNNHMVMSGSGKALPDSVTEVHALDYSMGDKGLYLIEWEAGDFSGKNHYLHGNPPFDLNDYIRWMNAADMLHADGFYQVAP